MFSYVSFIVIFIEFVDPKKKLKPSCTLDHDLGTRHISITPYLFANTMIHTLCLE